MTCRRICRELLCQARFGELGPGSAPHLEHLTDCRSCRDELGFDRALVRQLRVALAARVEGAAPSPRAWEGVLQRMAMPETPPSRLRAWSMGLVARLRFGSAMAGATLAIVMALNIEIVPVRPSDASLRAAPAATAPSRPLPMADGFPQAAASTPYAPTSAGLEESAAAAAPESADPIREPEQLPLVIRSAGPAVADVEEEAPVADPAPATTEAWEPVIRLVPADAAVVRSAARESEADDEPVDEPRPPASPLPSGAPS